MAGTDRYIEIDAARGVAILMMVLFHIVFDLSFFYGYPFNIATGFWRYFALSTASLFLLIVGVSLVISHAREEK
ncbi:MAG: heparan-alpha-glucosaminide N-acetyltransferase domain-containing protein, partial [Methanoregula sp.]|nr:heparan-alpha-glucosaminide N-acetyltransferase domain-containing protein [Methanoregula sp.]